MASPGRESSRAAELSSLRIRWASASLHCRAIAHGHLADRAARPANSARRGLRPEIDVDAEGPALPHQTVEQQRGLLRDLVVLDEEFLELVDDEQDSRQRVGRPRPCDSRSGLARRVAEPIGPPPHLRVEPLQHADAELAIALDGHHPGVRQLCAWRRS